MTESHGRALRAAGKPIPDAESLIRRYCGLDGGGTWAYAYYDALPPAARYDVGPGDVLPAAALHSGLRHADLAWFAARRADLAGSSPPRRPTVTSATPPLTRPTASPKPSRHWPPTRPTP